MNAIKFFAIHIFLLLFLGCGGLDGKKTRLFDIKLSGTKFHQNESIAVSIKNKDNITINSVSYFVDGKELVETDGKIILDVPRLGNKILIAKVRYNDTFVDLTKKIRVLAPNTPEIYTYEIVNEFPHDIKAYTQGLEFHAGILYESTGRKGQSSLRKVDFKTGRVLQQVDLDKTYFGEGLTVLDGKIYQLTWQARTGFVYDLKDLKKLDNFQYGESKEGWGLANDGEKLFKSDGTEKIWFLNPDTMVEEGYLETVTNKSVFSQANELEFVDGKLYANVYQKESMMIINASSGAIEGVVNFGGLKAKVTQHDGLDVLNGVAYHPERKTFFVTGKNWDKLFEVTLVKKQ